MFAVHVTKQKLMYYTKYDQKYRGSVSATVIQIDGSGSKLGSGCKRYRFRSPGFNALPMTNIL